MEFLYFLVPFRTPVMEWFFQLITYLGQEVVAITVICWIYWCVNKRLAYNLGFTYFISGLFVQGLKITFRVPRPWVIDPDFPVVPSALSAATGYSFPSGHTQSSTALFSTLGFHTRKPFLKVLCVLAFAGVGFSRMYLGCHTPKDVLTSMILTWMISFLCYRLLNGITLTKKQDFFISITFTAISILLVVYAYYLYRSNWIEIKYAQDCFKAAGAGLGFSIGYYAERHFIDFSMPSTTKGKVLRMVIGLAVTVTIQEGLKPVIGTSLPASFFRYLVVILWVLVFYPLLFRLFPKKG